MALAWPDDKSPRGEQNWVKAGPPGKRWVEKGAHTDTAIPGPQKLRVAVQAGSCQPACTANQAPMSTVRVLSRVRTLGGLWLKDWFKGVCFSPEAVGFYERLKTQG